MWFDQPTARAMLRALNGLASERFEAGLARLCGAAGSLSRRPSPWSRAGGSVLVVAPHPDDEVMGCAGSVLRHRRMGENVSLLLLTDGARSRALGLDGPGMSERREKEARYASRLMGAELRWAGLREGSWGDVEGRRWVDEALAQVRPRVIYAPSSLDFHPEHRRVARLVASALADSKTEAEVRIYAIQVPLTPLLHNRVHDVSDFEERIGQVFAAYASQQESTERGLRMRRYAARYHGFRAQAECFFALPAQRYAEVVSASEGVLRGLRVRSWEDPLAAMVGLGDRLRYRRAQAPSRR